MAFAVCPLLKEVMAEFTRPRSCACWADTRNTSHEPIRPPSPRVQGVMILLASIRTRLRALAFSQMAAFSSGVFAAAYCALSDAAYGFAATACGLNSFRAAR